MPRTKYFYNQKSLSFEKVSENRGYVLWRLLGISSLIIVSVTILSVIISRYITDSYDDVLDKKTKAAEFEIKQLQRDLRELDASLSDLREKDENIYRAIYGVAPPKIKEVDENDYQELLKLSHGKALLKLKKRLTELKALSEAQDKSYQQLTKLISQRSDLVNSIPAIMPVANRDLKRMASGFGYRLDPFYHTFTFHGGMDFTAETGTEVYATGDGRVVKRQSDAWGYGNHIIVNHGHGYTTVYAHLSRFAVNNGAKVKRGQLIGYVGSTGRSTGPHLHYEVRRNNNPLNPAFFYRNDLSDEDFQKMLELSQRETNRFD
jgi:murein DD-endopeptidase MepM/ murein hydrolase activator NlpD